MHIIKENSILHNGFNFYSLSDKSSFGFKFRYGKRIPSVNLGSKVFWFRYSKFSKHWILGNRG